MRFLLHENWIFEVYKITSSSSNTLGLYLVSRRFEGVREKENKKKIRKKEKIKKNKK